jgi:hypothetical protein
LLRYLAGAVLLIAVIGLCGDSARRLCRRHLPAFAGAPARVAEAIIAVAIVLGVCELTGVAGLLAAPSLVGGCLLVWVIVRARSRHWDRAASQPGEDGSGDALPRSPGLSAAIAAVAAALVAGHWAAAIAHALHGGMLGPDTLSYHGPIAATFARVGSIVHPPPVYQDPAVASYPDSSELLHAAGILLFSRDLLSPLLNLGWLALGLLAGWCLGRRSLAAALGVVAMAALMDLPVLSISQPGAADNDVMVLALLGSALAILFAGWPACAPGPVLVAALAAGLALGTKFSALVPVGLIGVVVLVALPDRRRRLLWLAGVLAGGFVWLGRNLFAFGSPVPTLSLGLGPLSFPGAHMPPSTSVADLLGTRGFVSRIVPAGLRFAFTAGWPLLLGLTLAGCVAIVVTRRPRLERALALTALASAGMYLVTPRTADGHGGLFAFNLRYLVPALVIGVALGVRALGDPARSHARRVAVGFGLSAGGALLALDLTHGLVFTAVSAAITAATLAASGLTAVLGRRGTLPLGAIALAALAVAAVALWPAQQTYLRTRYAGSGPFACEDISCTPLRFASDGHHLRIAMAGGLGPYLLYGADLSNTVTALVHYGPHGSWLPIGSCREFLGALARGHYAYAVVSPAEYVLPGSTSAQSLAWLQADPGAREIASVPSLFSGRITVFALASVAPAHACARSNA